MDVRFWTICTKIINGARNNSFIIILYIAISINGFYRLILVEVLIKWIYRIRSQQSK